LASPFDLVVRGGSVADGNGGALFDADIAVTAGRIVAVGRGLGRGREEVDATGKIVTPGFVDIHTHYDGQATWDDRLAPSSFHGVTTVVMGNCGVGFAPAHPRDRDRLIELMEGVEDIPGAALHEGLSWNWQGFPEFLDVLGSRSRDVDVCAQLPHGALRVFVMGERGARLEPATADDVAAMRQLACEAMRAGALGFSTSRTTVHRTVKGEPTPSLRASEQELTGIALGLADAGSGVIELVSDFKTADLLNEFSMIRRVVERSRRPLSMTLLQAHPAPKNWRGILSLIETANKDGLQIKAQVAPRPIGVLLGMQGTLNPFASHDAVLAIRDRPLAERIATMRNPQFRAAVLEQCDAVRQKHPLARNIMNFELIFPLGDPPDYEPTLDQSIASVARRARREPADVAYDLLLENDGRNFLFMPFANYADGHLDACREMIAHPDCVIGLGDGGAHVGIISDASFPTFLLAYWGRDRIRGRFDIGFLVKRQTADTARAVGLLDRGIIAPGMKADLNVIDFAALSVDPPIMAFDLPAGGKRLLQGAHGYDATIVSGEITYRNGMSTRALPGRLVRGPQPAP
jgi:N-acyl-D-aspartate/D-glutamate deacylase